MGSPYIGYSAQGIQSSSADGLLLGKVQVGFCDKGNQECHWQQAAATISRTSCSRSYSLSQTRVFALESPPCDTVRLWFGPINLYYHQQVTEHIPSKMNV